MATTVQVVGRYSLPNGEPADGKVIFTPSVTVLDSVTRAVVAKAAITAHINTAGQFSVDLLSGADPTLEPADFTYTVLEKIEGAADRTWTISVPDVSTPVELAWLSPTSTTPAVYDYVLGSTFAAAYDAHEVRIQELELGSGADRHIPVAAGAPTDADYTTPVDGITRVDSVTNRLWVRVGGVWKYTTLA